MEWFILFQKALASGFIILMIILLLFWCLPEGYLFRQILHIRFGKYIYWAGLDNYWALFAPNPISRNFLISFELEFEDGKVKPWKLDEFTIKNGYQYTTHFRYVKMHNQLLSQTDPVPKEAICRYVYREFLKTQEIHAPLSKIHIIRFYEPTLKKSPFQLPWLSQRTFTYDVVQNESATP